MDKETPKKFVNAHNERMQTSVNSEEPKGMPLGISSKGAISDTDWNRVSIQLSDVQLTAIREQLAIAFQDGIKFTIGEAWGESVTVENGLSAVRSLIEGEQQ